MIQPLQFTKLCDVKSPNRGTALSAGIDFFIPNDVEPIVVEKGESVVIPSGLHVNVPDGYAFIAFNKSGIAIKKKLGLGACVIDEDYQGQLFFNFFNHGERVILNPGDKIVQLLLVPVYYAEIEEKESLTHLYPVVSERGDGWQGSTGES